MIVIGEVSGHIQQDDGDGRGQSVQLFPPRDALVERKPVHTAVEVPRRPTSQGDVRPFDDCAGEYF